MKKNTLIIFTVFAISTIALSHYMQSNLHEEKASYTLNKTPQTHHLNDEIKKIPPTNSAVLSAKTLDKEDEVLPKEAEKIITKTNNEDPRDVVEIKDPGYDSPMSEKTFADEYFYHENYDSTWAPYAEQEVYTFIETITGTENQIDELECRQKTCKISIWHKNDDEKHRFLQSLVAKTPVHQGKLLNYEDDNGELYTLIYSQLR